MSRVSVFPVLAERFVCRQLHRAELGRNGGSAFALDAEAWLAVLGALGHRSTFLEPLNRIYGVDLSSGFNRLSVIRGVEASAGFAVDPEYRRAALEELCRSALERSGFLIARPGPGAWQVRWPMGSPGAPDGHVLQLCQLLGSLGFAQLCGDALDAPVPLFLQPWCERRGLLRPRRWPAESFSRMLCVARLENRHMILLEKPSGRV